MNLYETKPTYQSKKTNKIMMGLGIIIAILIVISIILFIVINNLQSNQFKFVIDTAYVNEYSNDLFVTENDVTYVSIKDISTLLNYKYYNGGYKQYSEDINSCYVESQNEIATFENGSNKIYKTPVDKVDYEFFTISNPIKMINNKLYISAEGLQIAFNVNFEYNKENNQVSIYTLPYLTNYYTTGYEYSSITNSFNNQKALLYNLLVVQNTTNKETSYANKDTRYGIITLGGKEVVGTKYTNIEFIESTREFIVTTEENKVGIITETGETKVRPQYDALKQIDKDLNLYLATVNNKKGIIEKNGKILIYLEYDEIGVDVTKFESNNIKNPYVLFGNAIPVKQNNKWGMFDIKGNLIVPLEYSGLGCIVNNRTANSTVIVPDVEGIVFAKEYTLEQNKKINLFGIINAEGKVEVPAGLQAVYFVVNNGREEYTMISYQGETFNVLDYYKQYVYNQNENN